MRSFSALTTSIVKDYTPLPTIPCASQELQQVFLNLIMNAGHAVDEGGEIRVATRAKEDSIAVLISDDGFTTKPVGEGTGLGLGIALEIVRNHGGSIGVESRPGQGTQFEVRLPLPVDRMEPQPQD